MQALPAVLAAGIWPAVPATGYWLLWRPAPDGGAPIPLSSRVSLAAAAGIAVWSVVLLGFALAGVFSPSLFGSVGWALSLVTAAALVRRCGPRSAFPRPTAWDFILGLGLLLAAVLYLGFPTECIYGGIDEGVYANHGISIARRGGLSVPYPWADDNGRLLGEVCGDDKCLFPGFYKTPRTLTPQFGHVLPVWLAEAYATAGPSALFRMNGVFGLLSLAVFYGFCSATLPRPVAVLAALFLALSPSQVWMARITLSEMLAQLFIWSGLMLFWYAEAGAGILLACWAGLLLGTSALVRLDCLFLAPVLLFAYLVKGVLAETEERGAVAWRALLRSAFPMFAAAAAYYAVFSKPYLRDHLLHVSHIAVGTALGAGAVLLARPQLLRRVRLWALGRTGRLLFALVVLAAVAYGYWFVDEVTPDYWGRNTLSTLAAYLSAPVVFAGIAGWWAAGFPSSGDAPGRYALVWTTSLSFTALYLGYHTTMHYHFWVVRRMVPVIIPALIFFSALALSRLLRRLPRAGSGAALATVAVALGIFLFEADRPLLAFAEHRGYFSQIRALAAKLPEHQPLLVLVQQEANQWPTPLYVSFGRPVIPINPQSPGARAVVSEWLAARAARGRPAFILCEEGLRFPGRTEELERAALSSSFLEKTARPLPRHVLSQSRVVRLLKVTGMSSDLSYLDVDLGAEWYWGVEESGFYNREVGPDGRPVRWTDGKGTLAVPMGEGRAPAGVQIDLHNVNAKETRLKVLVNDRELIDEPVPGGERWSRRLDLAGIPAGKETRIELASDTFVPANVTAGSSDVRTLGVLVERVRLLPPPGPVAGSLPTPVPGPAARATQAARP
jgi:hypothetical protein